MPIRKKTSQVSRPPRKAPAKSWDDALPKSKPTRGIDAGKLMNRRTGDVFPHPGTTIDPEFEKSKLRKKQKYKGA